MATSKAQLASALRKERAKRHKLAAAVREHAQSQRLLARTMAAAERDLARLAKKR
jgi:hypothetical protein